MPSFMKWALKDSGNISPGQLADNETGHFVRCLKSTDGSDTSNIFSPLTNNCPADPVVDNLVNTPVFVNGTNLTS
jgi:hypothetical protein